MNWKNEYDEGLQYAVAVKGLVDKNKVDNETLYHILCLSVEKMTACLTGMLNYIPMHSGLTFIFRELAKKMELPDHFLNEVRFLNGFMTYCSLDIEEPKEISQADMMRMVKFLNELISYTDQSIEKLN